ncbi:membrane-associated oxidoreductase [Streptomyces sp. NBC_00335]|uniref:membrane-associated oxidoreductase n=1 Tax=unclassified Streptomyces TaxID=2593676 RepID=UPI002259FB45|nr:MULTISPECIES: membrane-associated oxidoreductase [unclassified Streptomyces]MCX5408404.1 membrane-associated oxidoreductase [Streptomyces sp. NBC_00086]
MEINDLTPAERRVWDAFPRGEGVDFREDRNEEAVDGASWGPGRTVRAEVLAHLLLRGAAPLDGQVPGLNVRGARITGKLNLKYADIEHAIRLRACWFERKPILYGARLRIVSLSDSALPGLTASTVSVDIALKLSCCRITGPVRLAGARIAGGLFLQKAVIGTAGPAEEGQEAALQFNHADIGTDVIAMDLTVHGQTRINGATVGGQINLNNARLLAPGAIALHAETLTVGTDVRARGLESRGMFNLTGSKIPGQLYLADARLIQPGGVALRASSCAIGEVWLSGRECVQGTMNLRRSQFDLLHVPPETWPRRIRIEGLTYRALSPHVPAEQRLPALEREESGYLPYAYEQLAAAYRTVGDEAGARTVQLAKLRRHRRTLPRHARVWGLLQDATVGYGFRPLRAAGWLLALLLTGTAAYWFHPPRELKAGESPEFNPVFYTIDLMVPIISFGQEAAYTPSGWYQWLSYLLIVTGWVLATTTAAGVSRSLQRQ